MRVRPVAINGDTIEFQHYPIFETTKASKSTDLHFANKTDLLTCSITGLYNPDVHFLKSRVFKTRWMYLNAFDNKNTSDGPMQAWLLQQFKLDLGTQMVQEGRSELSRHHSQQDFDTQTQMSYAHYKRLLQLQ